MIRVLIAEDEPPIARAIARMVGELSPAISVAACVSNGLDALEYMRHDPVDVVFTDIRMPVMDGLELLQELRAKWPDCLTVILSGHQDFAYSQTAIRLGAFDYLLKPISREKLREMLDRLEDVHARNLLQEAVVSWRAGGHKPAADMSHAKDVTYSLILAIAGHWPAIADDALSPGAVFWQMNDPEHLIRDLPGLQSEIMIIVGRAAAERLFLLENIPQEKASAIANDMFDRLIQLSALPKTLCVMPGPLGYADIASAIRLARKRVYSTIGLCRSVLLLETESGVASGSVSIAAPGAAPGTATGASPGTATGAAPAGAPFTLSPDTLTEALCVRNEKQIGAAVDYCVDSAIRGGMTQTAFEHFLETVIHDRRLSLDTKPLKEELNEAILGAAAPAGLKADLTQIFRQYVLGESKAELKNRIEQIESYLSSHFAEEISSDTLSARFGFVPSYLSKVFRRQTGMSPTEYLTKRRMEKAKDLLETRPGILIREAALLVGYKDPYYFSKLFKKTTGLWPTQYQEEAQAGK